MICPPHRERTERTKRPSVYSAAQRCIGRGNQRRIPGAWPTAFWNPSKQWHGVAWSPPWRDVPVCFVVAHPDDETIGCGAQLSSNATVVVATDESAAELALSLDADAQARKRRMLACYAMQRKTLSGFASGGEPLR